MFNVFRRKVPVEMQEVPIGGGNLIVDLPAHYEVAQEEGDDIAAYDPDAEDGILRFTVYYLTGEQVRGADRLGIAYVRQAAQEARKRLERYETKIYFTDKQQNMEEDGVLSITRFWTVGFEDTVVLISCWASKAGEKSVAAQLAIESAGRAIRNLRNAPVHRYDAPEDAKQELVPLRPEDDEQLHTWRSAAHELVTSVLGRPRLMGNEQDFQVIQELLDNEARNTYDDDALHGLGVIFGDHLAQKLDMQWVTSEDSIWGSTPALTYGDLKLVLYPADMILKRVERSESFDVIELFNSLADMVRAEIASGKVTATDDEAPVAD